MTEVSVETCFTNLEVLLFSESIDLPASIKIHWSAYSLTRHLVMNLGGNNSWAATTCSTSSHLDCLKNQQETWKKKIDPQNQILEWKLKGIKIKQQNSLFVHLQFCTVFLNLQELIPAKLRAGFGKVGHTVCCCLFSSSNQYQHFSLSLTIDNKKGHKGKQGRLAKECLRITRVEGSPVSTASFLLCL